MVNQRLAYGTPVKPLKTQNLLTHRTAHGTSLGTLEDVGSTAIQG